MKKNKKILFYLHLHQPKRLRRFTIFDIGQGIDDYFDEEKNFKILERIVKESYLPTLEIFTRASNYFKDRFKIALSISGILVENLQLYFPAVIDQIKFLVDHRNVELIAETYFHSLSYIFNLEEFNKQVKQQKKLFRDVFDFEPVSFRNTELLYNNDLALTVSSLGFKCIMAEGADKVLQGRSPNYLYQATDGRTRLFVKNYRLSDDIAFRFSERSWSEWPLTVDKYLYWLDNTEGDLISLMMDFETFGEHHKRESGIFNFLEKFINDAILNGFDFIIPKEIFKKLRPYSVYNSHQIVTWADTERDLSAWLGNSLQQDASRELYSLYRRVLKTRNENFIKTFRCLQISDHFYYMCTKWFADGDVHKYFNPYGSPYEAYLNFMNVLEDFKLKL